jgi:hypothetical protein
MQEPNMTDPREIMFLPKDAEDGQEVADVFGNVWEYNTEQQEWIRTRFLQDSELVTETNDGLITPEIFTFIEDISDDVDDGVYDWMKLRTSPDSMEFGYFYYFYSSDKLIKFKPLLDIDGKMKLFIEINKRELHRKLLLKTCWGPKGARGLVGDTGSTGDPAKNEVFRNPKSVSGDTLEFEVSVATPIGTDISVRLFKDGLEQIEVIVPLSPSDPVTYDSDTFVIDTDASDASYDITAEIVSGTVVLVGDTFEDEWQLKARQIGPDGNAGADGSDFLTTENTILADSLITYNSSLVNMRNSGNTIFKLLSDITNEICVGILIPVLNRACNSDVAGLGFTSVTANPLIALERTANSCKDIGKFKFTPIEYKPALDFPHWVPTKQCMDQQRYDLSYLDWVSETSPQAPFQFLNDPRPDETCCQDKMFHCSNAGDACQVSGSIGMPTDVEPVDPSPSPGTGTGPSPSPSPSIIVSSGAQALGIQASLEGTISNIDPYKMNTFSGEMVNDTSTGEITETILNLENRVTKISYIHTFWNKMVKSSVEDANVYLAIKPIISPGGLNKRQKIGEPIKIPIDLSVKADLREQIGLGIFVNREESVYGLILSLASDHDGDIRLEGDLASIFIY